MHDVMLLVECLEKFYLVECLLNVVEKYCLMRVERSLVCMIGSQQLFFASCENYSVLWIFTIEFGNFLNHLLRLVSKFL